MTIWSSNVAEYRRKLTKIEHKNIVSRYKKHRDAEGGIFVPRTRRRLIGVKDEKRGQFRDDTPDFWSDVRSHVKTAITDLQLICEVTNQEQLKEMLQLVPFATRKTDETKASLSDVLSILFDYKLQYKRTKKGWEQVIDSKNILWKSELAHDIVIKCLKFYQDHGLITSKAHERLVEEVTDMLGAELSHAISRDLKLPYFTKF